MKLGAVFTSILLLTSTSLLMARPVFSAEKTLFQNSAVIHTLGPVTQSLYFQKPFIKRQAAFIRRNPAAIPDSVCDDIFPKDPIGATKIICKAMLARKDRILQAADSNQCLKVRFVNPAVLVANAVTVDKSKYCR